MNTEQPPPDNPSRELSEILKEANIKPVFWMCPDRSHKGVKWSDDLTIATCQVCGKTNQEITDTDRLNFLLNYIGVDNGYTNEDDKSVCGPLVNGDSLEEDIWNKGFGIEFNKQTSVTDAEGIPTTPKEGWEARVIVAGIDYAIRKEREI